MAFTTYASDGNAAHKVKKIYAGSDLSVAKAVPKVYVGDSNGVARQCFGDGDFWKVDGILDSECLAAYSFKGAESAAVALQDLTGHNRTLTNSGCTWSTENGYYIDSSKYLDNSSLRGSMKSIVMKVASGWTGNYMVYTGNWGGLSLWMRMPFEIMSFAWRYHFTGIGHDKNGTSVNYSGGGSLAAENVRTTTTEIGSGVLGVTSSGWGSLYHNGVVQSMRNAISNTSDAGPWTRWQKGTINIPRLVGGTGVVASNVAMNGHFYIHYLAAYSINLSAAQHSAIYNKINNLP